jgi:hypothetical protein
MLTLRDCIDFSGLTDEQLEAVARHEHLSLVVAAEWVEEMAECDEGCRKLAAILAEELADERKMREFGLAGHTRHALMEFLASHPGLGKA